MTWLTKFVHYSFLVVAVVAMSQDTQAQEPVAAPQSQVPVVQAPVANNCGCDGGAVSGCGRIGGYFNNARSQGCGVDNGCGQRGGVFQRLRSLIPEVNLSFGQDCGCEGSCDCTRRYRSFFGGAVDLNAYSGNDGIGPVSGSFKDGFILGTAAGQYINDNTRIELESSWRKNSGDTWTNAFGGTAPFVGRINNFSTMANVVREFGNRGPIGFYTGAGLGFSHQDGEFVAGATTFEIDDWTFAYQAFAGLDLMSTQNSSVFVEYRYMGNTNTDITANGVPLDDFQYDSQNIVFGFRFNR